MKRRRACAVVRPARTSACVRAAPGVLKSKVVINSRSGAFERAPNSVARGAWESRRVSMERVGRSMGDLRVGEAATVLRVRCARGLAVRLMEMGLVAGTPFEVRRVAPLGDPIELFVNGYALSLRREEALAIDVEPPANDAR